VLEKNKKGSITACISSYMAISSWIKKPVVLCLLSLRLLSCFLLSFTCQTKFVFAWKISEASLTAAGLNLEGFDEKTGKPKW